MLMGKGEDAENAVRQWHVNKGSRIPHEHSSLHRERRSVTEDDTIFDSLSVSARLAKLYKMGLCPGTSRAIWILGH